MPPQLAINLFGSLELKLGGALIAHTLAAKEQALLAYLVMEQHRSFPRDELAALFWPESSQSAARGSLRQALYHLRQALRVDGEASGFLLVKRLDLRFNPASAHWLDVRDFQARLEQTKTHPHHGIVGCESCVEQLQAAAALYRDDFLAGVPHIASDLFEEWRLLHLEQLRRQALAALTDLAVHFQRRRQFDQANRYLEQKRKQAPWDEDTYRQQMRLMAQAGNRSAALRLFDTLKNTLAQELDVAPSAETESLRAAILAGRLDPLPAAGDNPYKGLHPFDQEDASRFYGREASLTRLCDTIQRHPIVTVVGASGSGKTSLIQAGLIPRLLTRTPEGGQDESWLVTELRPGPRPFTALADALLTFHSRSANVEEMATRLRSQPGALHELATAVAREKPGQRCHLLVIDQFEEVYTQVADAAERQAFLNCIVETANMGHSPALVILLSLRADFTAQLLSYRPLADRVQQGGIVLGPMNRAELRQAIEEPALNQGLVFEAGLVERLLEDVSGEPGNLPLLQFALSELWQRRHQYQLTHAAYEAIGGVSGALARYAEHIYQGLSIAEQIRARDVLTRLVRPGEHTDDTRRLALKEEFDASGWQLLRKLADARLVVTAREALGAETVEVAHEALIHHWDRLRAWVDVNREFELWRQRLQPFVQQWEQRQQEEGLLLQGGLLAEAEGWMAQAQTSFSPNERVFIAASLARRDEFERDQEARRRRELAAAQALAESEQRRAESEARTGRRLRWLLVSMGLAFSITILASIYARQQWRDARTAAALAQSLNLTSNAQIALDDDQTGLALALALSATEGEDPPAQAQLMLANAAYRPGTRLVLSGHQGPVQDVAMTGDGRYGLSAGIDGALLLWDLSSGKILQRLLDLDIPVTAVTINDDDTLALSGAADGSIQLWSLPQGRPIRRFDGHEGAVRALEFAPGSGWALSGSADDSLILWDVASGKALRRLRNHESAVLCLAISPDGQTALSGAADGSVTYWQLSSGEVLRYFAGESDTVLAAIDAKAGHSDAVFGVSFSPDGTHGFSGSADRLVIEYDLISGEVHQRFDTFGESIYGMAINPASNTLVAGLLDGRLVIQDLVARSTAGVTSGVRWQMLGHLDRVEAVSITADGRRALTASDDSTLRLWDMQNGAEMLRLHDDYLGSNVDISANGRTCLSSLWYGGIRLWDCASGELIRELPGHEQMLFAGAYFTPDGRRVVSASGDIYGASTDNSVRVWDVSSGAELQRFDEHSDKVWDLAVSEDGRFAASVSHDGTVRLWDLEAYTGRVLYDVSPQAARSVAFSPDGKTLLVGLAKGQSEMPDYSLRLIDSASGAEIRRFQGHSAVVSDVAYSPDGVLALSSSIDRSILLWDVASGSVLHRLEGHSGSVISVAFSPDGKRAASAGNDYAILIWDVASGQALRRLLGHSAAILEVTFFPDGRRLLSTANDDTVRIWRLDEDDRSLQTWIAANRFVPELTCEQRLLYNVTPLCE